MASSDGSDDHKSILNCVRSDGSLDFVQALASLAEDDDVCHIDEPSIFTCISSEGGLDIHNFLKQQHKISLLELSILKEAGLIDNGSILTNSNAAARVRPFVARNSRSMLYEVWEGGYRRQAMPSDSNWWKMYVEHPMLNIPKFH